MSASAQALNYEIIDDLHGVLGESYTEILNDQVEQATEYLDELAEHLQQNHVDEATRAAHSLKSSAGQIGLKGIHALANELELVCTADVAAGICSDHAKALHKIICDEILGAVAALCAYIAA